MAIEHCFEEAPMQNSSYGEEKSTLGHWESISSETRDSLAGFDCNICLETVQDPVVTLCGHLFCWPCIYKWLHFQTLSEEKPQTNPQHQCPVCKSQISHTTLVPLYGKGQTTNPSKTEHQNPKLHIPSRPSGPDNSLFDPSSMNETHDRYYQSRMGDYGAAINVPSSDMSMANMFNPTIGVFGETVYERAFGSTITNLYVYPNSYNLLGSSSGNPRIRRHIIEADKSLNRICLFFFCCLILCLLLF